MDRDMNLDLDLDVWDEAERNLRQQGWAHSERRHHSPSGRNDCTSGDPQSCPGCAANGRAHEAYREALFAEMARLREAQAHT
jgi:hypothetical protein